MWYDALSQASRRARRRLVTGDESITAQLARSRNALRTLQWRIKATWLLISLVLGIGFEVYDNLFPDTTDELYDNCVRQEGLERCDHSHDVSFCTLVLNNFWRVVLFKVRLMSVALAPLTDDVWFCRLMVGIDALMILEVRFRFFFQFGLGIRLDETVRLVSAYGRGVIYLGGAIFSVISRTPSVIQKRMWSALALFILLNLVEDIVYVTWQAIEHRRLSPRIGCCLAQVVPLIISLSERARGPIQVTLRRWLEGAAAGRGSASLACLLGEIGPKEALAFAREHFTCMRFDALTLEMLLDNKPNPAHGALAEPCALTYCDAFLSHSWSDDATAKWGALKAWGAEFCRREGREPSVWFDKCCIDQASIAVDLPCLPIYLKGCKRLVVLCGPTYLSRLWCIIEIFTHVHTGGHPEEIELVQVLRAGHELEDAAAIAHTFDTFDVRECACYDPADQQRLVDMIQLAFGGAEDFNRVVRRITRDFHRKLAVGSSMVPFPLASNMADVDSSDSDDSSDATSSAVFE